MPSVAERITAAVHAALVTPPLVSVPAARVFRDLQDALGAGALPAIAIETGDESEPVRHLIGHKMRTVEIRVTVLAAGQSPYSAADPVLVESFGRLAANPTLGGLAFEFDEGITSRDREGADQHIAAVTKTYFYGFRTTEGSIES